MTVNKPFFVIASKAKQSHTLTQDNEKYINHD